jgi:hypothetical protein
MKNLNESLLEPIDEAAGVDVWPHKARREAFSQIVKSLSAGADMLKLWRLQDSFADPATRADLHSIEQSLYSLITSLEGLGDLEDWT